MYKRQLLYEENELNENDPLSSEEKLWEKCAIQLCTMNDQDIQQFLSQMMTIWLKDLRKPGATEVLRRLKSMPQEMIQPYLNEALYSSINLNDDQWRENLSLLV